MSSCDCCANSRGSGRTRRLTAQRQSLTVVARWSNGLSSLPAITWKSGGQRLVCAATEESPIEHRAGCGCVDTYRRSCLLRLCLRSRAWHPHRAMSSSCPRSWPRFFASPARKPTCTLAQRFPFATSGLGWFIRLPWLFLRKSPSNQTPCILRWVMAPSGLERCTARWSLDCCSLPSFGIATKATLSRSASLHHEPESCIATSVL